MKKIATFLILSVLLSSCQVLEDIWDEISEPAFTEEEAARALEDALRGGVREVVTDLNKQHSYLNDNNIKIEIPEPFQDVEEDLRNLGMDRIVDHVIVSMNLSAEEAVSEAGSVFYNAISGMTINDAVSIARGEDDAATVYLRENTRVILKDRYSRPVRRKMDQNGVLTTWERLRDGYQQLPGSRESERFDFDIEDYVIEKALDGLFHYIAEEEKKIRHDPAKRATEMTRKVFGEIYGS